MHTKLTPSQWRIQIANSEDNILLFVFLFLSLISKLLPLHLWDFIIVCLIITQ